MESNRYAEALRYLYSFTDYEKRMPNIYSDAVWDLRRMEELLSLLGNPHRQFRSIHIAGTKGKGSTAAMIDAMLRAGGLQTGLYTSPHLHTFRERIAVGGQPISVEEVIRLSDYLKPYVAQVPGLTAFEVITTLALLRFAQQKVDVAVLEVGLGGRLDATNIITPAVTIITSLSYDHMALLGHTLADIAREKAGIIKEGAVVLSAPQQPDALAVIEESCRKKGASLQVIGRDWHWQAGPADLDGQFFGLREGPALPEAADELHEFDNGYWIPLLGLHQLTNASLAVMAVRELNRKLGAQAVSDAHIRAGLRKVRWPGRLEILGQRPFVVVDGAHNGDSSEKLMAALQRHFSYGHVILVFGASQDKDLLGMFENLLPRTSAVVFARAHHPRAMDAAQLAAQAQAFLSRQPAGAHEPIIYESTDVAAALSEALHLAGPGDLVCATGSLFLAAEVREAWARLQGQEPPATDPEI
ncbi:MAG: bifunctional folylpolyglutamate synthase/dihydrofolate synthase [Chloroflexi bacterium]|nr:bifunctional folylpolyglutamate synthase/dihydrofolate synthase [Chloroflexota bacterium]